MDQDASNLVVTQGALWGGGQDIPIVSGAYRQVKLLLERYPECRGHVGRTVSKYWAEFSGIDQLIENGQVDAVHEIISGERKGVPNYKTVSRAYHRVCKDHPHLYVAEEDADVG